MNPVRQIAFGYSTQCNIRCGHCVAADASPAIAKMDFDRAKKILREMARFHVTGISFTAGEFHRQRIFTDYQPNVCTMNPYLSPELDMYACCDAANRFSKTDFLYLGNLRNNSIDTLFRKGETHILYHLIRTMGLTNMASYLGFKAREIVQYRKCELCEKLFNSKENLSILTESARSELIHWRR